MTAAAALLPVLLRRGYDVRAVTTLAIPEAPTIAPPVYLPISRTLVDGDVVKFCQRTPDGHEIESVIIPMGARDNTWRTLCVSSQIGCARGCAFCQTARMGLLRNLSVDEILGQVVAARVNFAANIRNVVFMGMGEPMDNLDNVIESIRRMNDEAGRDKAGALSYHAGEAGALSYHAGRAGALSNQRDKAGALSNQRDKAGALSYPIPRRRVTVSTVGRCEGIRRLAALGWRRLNLAVSLNAPNDEIRSRIMPINRVEPMAELREAIRAYPVRAGGHVLIEYVLIKDVNDRPEHARELAEYLAGLSTCVNLIPYNPIEGGGQSTEQVRQSSKGVRQSSSFVRSSSVPFEPSTEAACDEFQTILMQLGQLCFRRWTKGQRAMAACGQLGNLALRRFSR